MAALREKRGISAAVLLLLFRGQPQVLHSMKCLKFE